MQLNQAGQVTSRAASFQTLQHLRQTGRTRTHSRPVQGPVARSPVEPLIAQERRSRSCRTRAEARLTLAGLSCAQGDWSRELRAPMLGKKHRGTTTRKLARRLLHRQAASEVAVGRHDRISGRIPWIPTSCSFGEARGSQHG